MDGRLASQRWADCIQLYSQFVSLNFRIFHRPSSFAVNGVNLQETCLTSQLMDWGFNECEVMGQITGKSKDGGGERKNVVFIVYNFFEKCLNQSLAAAFRAPKRCGLLFN
ncbi:hypothetical protein DOZ69_28430 [Pseudomonas fluorescens]|uniref:Uncharacterized protein n=1 Tax=Pseudomonas fluorescens (strain Pf0-1) TaxID=205922 RepID=Q3KFK6_PSEPF|nr:hypothetical protein Pfl01_1707 [Pseudomonas fluorescens Pf0-1]AWA38761.1 hypothetical protein DBV33_09195 [Pseudomonas fluorescens]RAI61289.1 hypothetical protein DOZ69_28430 [Pseudomonas fluorescens]